MASYGLAVFDAARALRRSAASFTCGCSGIVEIAEGVDAIRDIDGRETKADITRYCATEPPLSFFLSFPKIRMNKSKLPVLDMNFPRSKEMFASRLASYEFKVDCWVSVNPAPPEIFRLNWLVMKGKKSQITQPPILIPQT